LAPTGGTTSSRDGSRRERLEDFEQEDDWEEVIRTPSPRNPAQKKPKSRSSVAQKDDELYVLCLSDGRQQKDRAIRQQHEQRLRADLDKLKKRIETGHLKKSDKIHQALGRPQERYPCVARY
jgi:hypothetical protein